jgi:hypothetical protein
VLWAGTASSWVNLNPAGYEQSGAYATSGTQQAGFAYFNGIGGGLKASLWSGTASSWVNLNPPNSGDCVVFGMNDQYQVGFAGLNNTAQYQTAVIWNGTAASCFDLGALLPTSTYQASRAESVWSDETTLYVAGWAINDLTLRYEAVLWSRPIPTPTTVGLLAGVAVVSGARRRRA